jgi:hypothetical protein
VWCRVTRALAARCCVFVDLRHRALSHWRQSGPHYMRANAPGRIKARGQGSFCEK